MPVEITFKLLIRYSIFELVYSKGGVEGYLNSVEFGRICESLCDCVVCKFIIVLENMVNIPVNMYLDRQDHDGDVDDHKQHCESYLQSFSTKQEAIRSEKRLGFLENLFSLPVILD